MNINFGLFPPLVSAVKEQTGIRLRGSEKTRAKRRALSARALVDLEQWIAGDRRAAAAE
jgi:methylenetetrahydrofolate--tRNA-(uracil-5-)-methyltransferase